MSNTSPLVRINFDTAEDIEKLFGIGRKLAERIVSYRNSHHYFQNPEDLAKVEGVSLQLAITISPQIDWQLPTEQAKYEKPGWDIALFCFIAILIYVWLIKNRMLPSINYSFYELQMGIPNAWVLLLIDIALTISISSLGLMYVVYFIVGLFPNLISNRLKNILYFFFVGTFLIGGLVSGIGHAVNYSLSNNWQSLFTNAPYLLGVTGFMVVFLVTFPLMFVLWKPALATNLFLSRIYDIGILLGALGSAWSVWQFYRNQPLWVSIAWGFFGAAYLSVGLASIRIGHSFYFEIATNISLIQSRGDELSVWKKWINSRLPDPEQQQALKKALEEMYPPSRFNTFVYAVVFGAGGWLLLTALSAVIQWFIENILDTFFH